MTETIIGWIQRFTWMVLIFILLFGWFSPVWMLLTFICMIAPIVFSFKYGRAWCGNFCPRGSFNKSVLKWISPNKPLPVILKKPLIRLVVFIGLMTLFTYSLLNSGGSLRGLGVAFIRMMAITTLIEICMAVFVHHNAWCVICPMGSVAGTITAIKGNAEGVVTVSAKCINCQECVSVCPMQINIPGYQNSGVVVHSDCMKCRECINHCKYQALCWKME